VNVTLQCKVSPKTCSTEANGPRQGKEAKTKALTVKRSNTRVARQLTTLSLAILAFLPPPLEAGIGLRVPIQKTSPTAALFQLSVLNCDESLRENFSPPVHWRPIVDLVLKEESFQNHRFLLSHHFLPWDMIAQNHLQLSRLLRAPPSIFTDDSHPVFNHFHEDGASS